MVLADRLRDARRRRFVGRAAELELFETALDASAPPFAVLFVHGPGGVGKTALLRTLAEAAERAGVPATYVDMRSIAPSPSAFVAAAGAREGPQVLLLDTYETAGAIDGWLRERFLPDLPSEAIVVIAGRDPPAPAWRADPGWCDLLRTVSLRNLDPDDARAYLRVEGVPESQHEDALAATHGHPLALRLLVDVLAQRSGPVELGAAPDVVRELLERFVAGAPSARHRQVLDICAHRATTEDLLASALGGEDSADLFDWLRTLSFVEQGLDGAFPHDIVRDALDADLRWRDRAGYVDQHKRIRGHVIARIRATSGDEQQRGVADLIFLHRNNPFARAMWDWESFGLAHAEPARPGDRAAILAMVERHEGLDSRALAEYWLDRQPHAFVVFRGADSEPFGFVATLALHLRHAPRASAAGRRGAVRAVLHGPRRLPAPVPVLQPADDRGDADVRQPSPARVGGDRPVGRPRHRRADDALHRLPPRLRGHVRGGRPPVPRVRQRLAAPADRGLARHDGRAGARRGGRRTRSGPRAGALAAGVRGRRAAGAGATCIAPTRWPATCSSARG